MSGPLPPFNTCVKLLARGTATVMGNSVPAHLVLNPYGQRIVWGYFGVARGKFKGTLANDANTEGVEFCAEA